MIRTKRAYEPPSKEDGFRILVDRLWPRGMSKESAQIDLWLKDVAPSDSLRKWFSHDPEKWPGFKERYHKELEKKSIIRTIRSLEEEKGAITLLYSAKDTKHNNAVFLQEYLQRN